MKIKYRIPVLKISSQLLFFILLSMAAIAQLQEVVFTKSERTTVGESKWLGKTKASLKYSLNKADTSFLLYMQDEEKLKDSRDKVLIKYFSIRYRAEDNTVD